MLEGLELAGRGRRRIAADPAGVEGVHVDLGELLAARAGLGGRVALRLVAEPDLAPLLGPVVLVEAFQRRHYLFGILALEVLERVEPAGAAHELGLDLVQCALARALWLVLDVHVMSLALVLSSNTLITGAVPEKPSSVQRDTTLSYIFLSSWVRGENDLMCL